MNQERKSRRSSSKERSLATGRIEVSASPASSTSTIEWMFGSRNADFAMWEKLGVVVRLSYGIGTFGHVLECLEHVAVRIKIDVVNQVIKMIEMDQSIVSEDGLTI